MWLQSTEDALTNNTLGVSARCASSKSFSYSPDQKGWHERRRKQGKGRDCAGGPWTWRRAARSSDSHICVYIIHTREAWIYNFHVSRDTLPPFALTLSLVIRWFELSVASYKSKSDVLWGVARGRTGKKEWKKGGKTRSSYNKTPRRVSQVETAIVCERNRGEWTKERGREKGDTEEPGRSASTWERTGRGRGEEYRSDIHMYVGRGYNVFKLREKGLYLPREGYIGDR